MLGLLLNVATIILGCIFSMLLSDFRARGLKSVPIPLMMALTEFFHADTEINIHPLPELRYFFLLCYDSFYVLVCTPYLYYALPLTLSAPVAGVLMFLYSASLYVLCFCI